MYYFIYLVCYLLITNPNYIIKYFINSIHQNQSINHATNDLKHTETAKQGALNLLQEVDMSLLNCAQEKIIENFESEGISGCKRLNTEEMANGNDILPPFTRTEDPG